jgi:uncharacterized coiled-coil protein SlyX
MFSADNCARAQAKLKEISEMVQSYQTEAADKERQLALLIERLQQKEQRMEAEVRHQMPPSWSLAAQAPLAPPWSTMIVVVVVLLLLLLIIIISSSSSTLLLTRLIIIITPPPPPQMIKVREALAKSISYAEFSKVADRYGDVLCADDPVATAEQLYTALRPAMSRMAAEGSPAPALHIRIDSWPDSHWSNKARVNNAIDWVSSSNVLPNDRLIRVAVVEHEVGSNRIGQLGDRLGKHEESSALEVEKLAKALKGFVTGPEIQQLHVKVGPRNAENLAKTTFIMVIVIMGPSPVPSSSIVEVIDMALEVEKLAKALKGFVTGAEIQQLHVKVRGRSYLRYHRPLSLSSSELYAVMVIVTRLPKCCSS